MKFESITIKNFRNFEDITVTLSNRNIFFGLNDVGKTNFLYAFRYLLDKGVRKCNLSDSDYHNKKINNPIEITVAIDISDKKNIDNQKLRAKLRGAVLSSHEKVYIKLVAEYDDKEMIGIPVLYWGGDLANLYEMKQKGYLYEVDYIFNIIYIDSYVDLYALFKKNVSSLIRNSNDEDRKILEDIENTVNVLNSHISSLSGIKEFEEKVTPEYKKFRNEDVAISVKSEIAVKGLYSNIVPYIKRTNDSNLYPTSGEGRKKLLAYSIFDIMSEESEDRKINLFLIEEPENHLHKSMQIALSQILFRDEKYRYLFVSTHSPFVLYEMDTVNLVRIYNKTRIDSASTFYKIPSEYEKSRKMLNRGLSEAIFADRVLLVEGPSEQMLFEKVLSSVSPFYEAEGGYILCVDGIRFTSYLPILRELNIHFAVKTDNDLRYVKSSKKYSVLGFSRCNGYIGKQLLPVEPIEENTIESKRKLYEENIKQLDELRDNYKIFLSRCDLENDLDEAIHDKLQQYLDTDDVVGYLQDSKHYHMIELIEKLTDEDCNKIFEHYNFACLKEVIL